MKLTEHKDSFWFTSFGPVCCVSWEVFSSLYYRVATANLLPKPS